MSALSDGQRWEASNTAYLSAALDWLRLRLGGLAQQVRPDAPGATTMAQRPEEEKSRWNFFWRPGAAGGPAQVVDAPLPLLAAPPETVQQASLNEAAARMAEAAASDPRPAMVLLGQRLGLSQFEQEILLLAVAMELDTVPPGSARPPRTTRRGPTRRSRSPSPCSTSRSGKRSHPSGHCATAVPGDQPARRPAADQECAARRRAHRELCQGLERPRRPARPPLTPVPPAGSAPPSQQPGVDAILTPLRYQDGPRVPPLVRLAGPDAASKRHVAARPAQSSGSTCTDSSRALPTHAGELETLARLWRSGDCCCPLPSTSTPRPGKGLRHGKRAAAAVRFAMRTGGSSSSTRGPPRSPLRRPL